VFFYKLNKNIEDKIRTSSLMDKNMKFHSKSFSKLLINIILVYRIQY